MTQHERRTLRGWILRADHVETSCPKIVYNIEYEFCNRRVVQHIPGTEEQSVLAVAELRNAEADASTAIVAEVVGEIVIQIIGLRTVIVDDEFQIVPDATARGIDAAVVI